MTLEHQAGGGLPILPFYLCVDVSVSMTNTLPALNEELPMLKRAIDHEPMVGEIARLAIITFSDEAEMVLPLTDLIDIDVMPELVAHGATNFADVFELLYAALPHDVEYYKQYGATVLRPCVFFISDGQPTSRGWEQWHAALVDPSWHYRPNIVAFGFGDADQATIGRVANTRAFIAAAGENPNNVLKDIAGSLVRSMIQSGSNVQANQARLSVEAPTNMIEIPIDPM
jgi:uncharacterized protein YegL